MNNFDKETNRFNISSLKWNVKENELPMWVADMDFLCPDAIYQALLERLNNKTYGYSIIPDSLYDSYMNFYRDRHHLSFAKENMLFSSGVIPSTSSIIRRITAPGENIILMTPVYNIFFNSIVNNGRFISEVPLKYENYKYDIDFCLLEEKLAEYRTNLLILCNPHNPIGKIWSKEELAKIATLAKKHNVYVISDEIHCDLTNPNKEYVPFFNSCSEAKEIGISLISPTKSFNLAGLQTSMIIVFNQYLYNKINRGINNDEIAEPNFLACVATEVAYNQCRDYLDDLRKYIFSNREIVKNYFEQHIKEIQLIDGEATYLLWIDCSQITHKNSKLLAQHIRNTTGLYLSEGSQYGSCGKTFLRMNIATQKFRVLDGLERLKEGIRSYKES
ncbi:putative C-S lyase [Helicobacter sp. MIT 11-5569]|uniref:MalY/PatB family protein n=1 Tax=Helicobacter sp. MIT 11-5569 TaxID=1548151 RepID=UPI00051FBA2A|nr:PatB family C-S lyase [Helicobacter sp. MIT 11-5569]TLD83295.1 putative C-S lyase [Helicobacter sp. MIT 11-5569]